MHSLRVGTECMVLGDKGNAYCTILHTQAELTEMWWVKWTEKTIYEWSTLKTKWRKRNRRRKKRRTGDTRKIIALSIKWLNRPDQCSKHQYIGKLVMRKRIECAVIKGFFWKLVGVFKWTIEIKWHECGKDVTLHKYKQQWNSCALWCVKWKWNAALKMC